MTITALDGKGAAATRLADRRINVWEGSVRSGKTVGSILKWLQFVRTAAPGNLLMVGKTERTLTRNIIEPIVAWLGPKRARHVIGSGELWVCGRRIYLVGANNELAQDKIRGLTLVGAYVDEATLVPETFWTMLLSRLSEPGAKLFATTNPDNPAHWFKRDYLDRAAVWLTGDGQTMRFDGPDRLDLARFSFRLDDNLWLLRHNPSYVEQLKREYVGLWYRRYILGEWIMAEGSIYSMWDPARHVVSTVPDGLRWIGLGVDYGTQNPFAALLLGLGRDPAQGRNRLYLAREWRWDSRRERRHLTDAEYSTQLRGWLDTQQVRPEWTCVDPSAASFVEQLYRDGLVPTGADNAVVDGIRLTASLLASDQLAVHTSCAGWIDEVPGYVWDQKSAEAGEDKPVKLMDHSLDAGRYVLKTTEAAWRASLVLVA